MFNAVRKKDKKVYEVYSVQMIIGANALGQPAPTVVFLIYNAEKARWELVEADEFHPAGADADHEEPAAATSDSILLK